MAVRKGENRNLAMVHKTPLFSLPTRDLITYPTHFTKTLHVCTLLCYDKLTLEDALERIPPSKVTTGNRFL